MNHDAAAAGVGDQKISERKYRIDVETSTDYIEVTARVDDDGGGVLIDDGSVKAWLTWKEAKALQRLLMKAICDMRQDIATEMHNETMEKLRRMRDGETA